MNFKRNTILKGALLVVLLIVVSIVAFTIVLSRDKDARTAKEFVELLKKKDLIATNQNINDINFSRIETNKKGENQEYITLVSNEYGVDLDKDYNVIGFLNKAIQKGEVNITTEQSKETASKYLPILYSGDWNFKKIIGSQDEEVPFYTVVFSKCKDGYPYYSDEITISIDKSNGKLAGFTNVTTQGVGKNSKVILKIEEAEKIALDKFNGENLNGSIIGDTYLAYVSKVDDKKHSYLSYCISIEGKDKEGKEEVSSTYFISSQSGEIIDIKNLDKVVSKNK